MSIKRPRRAKFSRKTDGNPRFYGRHAVMAALANPKRRVLQILYSGQEPTLPNGRGEIVKKAVSERQLARFLPPGAIHQGLAAEVEPLQGPNPEEIADLEGIVLVLDQTQDPRNIGAILRTAAFFNVRAVVATDRRFPKESGVMAKAASGALEVVPVVRTPNLAAFLRRIASRRQVIGLSPRGELSLADLPRSPKPTLALGGEGKGLRRLVAENCHQLCRLTEREGETENINSLNVSVAAALAIYELSR